jgi:hypothetical protein
MLYKFNFAGWYIGSTDQEQDRTTSIAPTNLAVTEVEGEMRSNWTGSEWIEMSYVHSEAPLPQAKPSDSLIDIGPFFDRFGAAKMAILMSPNPMVQAIIKDAQIRKWIDLKKVDIAQALSYISSVVPELTQEIIDNVLHLPVEDFENIALRKTYFPN